MHWTRVGPLPAHSARLPERVSVCASHGRELVQVLFQKANLGAGALAGSAPDQAKWTRRKRRPASVLPQPSAARHVIRAVIWVQ